MQISFLFYNNTYYFLKNYILLCSSFSFKTIYIILLKPRMFEKKEKKRMS